MDVDEVIAEYAAKAEFIIEHGLAGSHTWTGFLASFLREVRAATGEDF